MEKQKKDNNIHKGHRKKVRNRYYECGLKGMPEHNILEFLLFFGIQRKDTNEIAHELINRFGSLSSVFEAKREDLMKVKGMTENAACLITMILPLYSAYVDDLSSMKEDLVNNDGIVNYLQGKFSKRCEQVYILCFNSDHSFITCRLIGEGDIASSTFDSRKLISVVLETNARMVVMAHNHPHGIHMPSAQDIEVTQTIYNFLKTINVKLIDHLIVTDDNYSSLASLPRSAHIFYETEPLFKD